MFWNLFTSRLKTQSCVDKKSSFSHWDSSSKQWLIGPNWSHLGPIRRILSYVTASGYIFFLLISLLVLQKFATAGKSGNIRKSFFSSDTHQSIKTSDNDLKFMKI